MKKILILVTFILAANNYLASQCFPDRHNSNWFDGWISCSVSANPNTARGNTHWLLYDLNHKYKLGQMHIWNSNSVNHLNDGIKNLVIDISDDGINWVEVGQYQFQKANGSTKYEGFEGPNLEGFEGKYLLITGLSNWGGDCFGLSEIKIDVLGIVNSVNENLTADCFEVNISPNPISSAAKANISVFCSNEKINYTIQDVTGRILKSGGIVPYANNAVLDLDLKDFIPGIYILNFQQKNLIVRKKLIKLNSL